MVKASGVIISFHASPERECIYFEVAQDMLERQESQIVIACKATWVGRSCPDTARLPRERPDKMEKLTELMPNLLFNGQACF